VKHNDISYRIEKTSRGLDTIIVTSGGREVPLHSKVDPEREADLFRDRFDPARYDALIVLGAGLGYHLVPLREIINEYSRIILIDILSGIETAIDRNPLTSFLLKSPRVLLVEGKSPADAERILSDVIDMDAIRGISVLEHPASLRIFGEYYGGIKKSIDKMIAIKAGNKATRQAFGPRYLRNILLNFGMLDTARPVRDLFGAFRQFPAVIAGSGPSLETDLERLGSIQDRVFIVAVDSAAPALQRAGVAPDVIVSIDPQPYVLEHFLNHGAGAIHVLSITSHPSIVKLLNGFISLNSHPFSQLAFQACGDSIGTIDSSTGTVAGDAVSLCAKCGFSAVGITGIDFSFSDFIIYARGTAYQKRYSVYLQDRLSTVEERNMRYIMKSSGGQKYGGKYTRRSFLHYRQALEDFIRAGDVPELYALNDRGISISGVRTRGLDEFAAKNCPAVIDKKRVIGGIQDRSRAIDAGPIIGILGRISDDGLFDGLLEASLGRPAKPREKLRCLEIIAANRRV
jgi:hypothetical protein